VLALDKKNQPQVGIGAFVLTLNREYQTDLLENPPHQPGLSTPAFILARVKDEDTQEIAKKMVKI